MKVYDVSFLNYDINAFEPLEDAIEWSDGDTFGISFDSEEHVVFTHNGNVIHTRDGYAEYVNTEGATSQVGFSSHWHLQGTPVYDLSFSAL